MKPSNITSDPKNRLHKPFLATVQVQLTRADLVRLGYTAGTDLSDSQMRCLCKHAEALAPIEFGADLKWLLEDALYAFANSTDAPKNRRKS